MQCCLTPLSVLPIQGYVDAAEIFHKESDTKPGVDLAAITDRMEIRKAVQSGDIQQAIEKFNDLNPDVSCSILSQLLSKHILALQRFQLPKHLHTALSGHQSLATVPSRCKDS